MTVSPTLVEPLARAGFAAKGVVYLILGLLALLAGLGTGGRVTDPRGAVISLLAQPFGRAVVAVLGVGLALYAAWRFLEAFADANRVGRTGAAIADRIGWAISGTVYALLSVDAAQVALRRPAGSGGVDLPRTFVASPLAPWLLTLIAIAIVLYALKEIRRAAQGHLSERLNIGRLTREAGRLVVGISRVGIIARAIVMIALGVVLLRGRLQPARTAATTDVSDSLRLLAALPSGPWGLTLIAAGLMAYGVYQLVHARYRAINPP